MPTGKSLSPGRWPLHDVLRSSFFPKSKINLFTFLILAVKVTTAFHQIFNVAARKNSIVIGLIVFFYIKINGAIHFISQPKLDQFFCDVDLLNDMPRGRRLNARWKDIEYPHYCVEIFGVSFYDFHRLELLEAGLLPDFILTFIGITFQVTNIRDVSNVPNFIAEKS